MLVSFMLKNFRSFKEPAMLSLLPVQRLTGEEHLNETHLMRTDHPKYGRLLRSAAIYGANASGKTNLLKGLTAMQDFVLSNLTDIRPVKNFPLTPFAFSEETVHAPVSMEVQTLQAGRLYRYGFEVTPKSVVTEWLYCDEKPMFEREGQEFDLEPSFHEGQGKETQTRDNALFLSVCHSYNGPVSGLIVKGLFEKIYCDSPFSAELPFTRLTNDYFKDPQIEDLMKHMIRLADPGIESLQKRWIGKGESDLLQPFTIDALHSCEGVHNKLDIKELSAGTLKWINIASLICYAMINGGIIVIDEIDIQLHPHLIDTLLTIFHSEFQKPVQLIFTTHNTYPLRQKSLRRDQVWFVNKLSDLSSELVNFSETKVRTDGSYEKDYLNGRYSGVPQIDLPEIPGVYMKEGSISKA